MKDKKNDGSRERVTPGFTLRRRAGSNEGAVGRKVKNIRRNEEKSSRQSSSKRHRGKKRNARFSRFGRGRVEYYRFEKAVWSVLGCFILLLGLALGARLIINALFIRDYGHSRYDRAVREEKLLTKVNFPEGYIPYYNIGCAYYEKGEYQQAEAWFRRALRQSPPHQAAQEQGESAQEIPEDGSTYEDPADGSTQTAPDLGTPTRASVSGGYFMTGNSDAECNIRVNTALSIIRQIDADYLDTESGRTKAVEKLQNARGVLTQEGCADAEDDGGHDENAVELRNQIDEWLSQLRNQEQSQGQNPGDDDSDSSDGQDNSDSSGNSDGQSDDGSSDNSGEDSSGGNSGDQNSGGNSSGGDESGTDNSGESSGLNEDRIRRELERSMEESREEQRQNEEDEKYNEYYYYGDGSEGNGGVWW